MAKMIAIRSMSYATRRLKAGDEFDARNQHARILNATGRARYATRHVTEHQAPNSGGQPVEDAQDGLAVLRARYHEVVGKRPFHGWDAEELQRRINEAEGS